MIKWSLVTKPIISLIFYNKNPRYITEKDLNHLKDCIEKFGLIDKPVINLDNTVIGGHQRINALKIDHTKNVECWIPDRLLDDKEVEELCIRLNKNTGEWQLEVLANEWNLEDLLEWGFNEKELGINPILEMEAKEEDEEEKEKNISCPKCGHEFLK